MRRSHTDSVLREVLPAADTISGRPERFPGMPGPCHLMACLAGGEDGVQGTSRRRSCGHPFPTCCGSSRGCLSSSVLVVAGEVASVVVWRPPPEVVVTGMAVGAVPLLVLPGC